MNITSPLCILLSTLNFKTPLWGGHQFAYTLTFVGRNPIQAPQLCMISLILTFVKSLLTTTHLATLTATMEKSSFNKDSSFLNVFSFLSFQIDQRTKKGMRLSKALTHNPKKRTHLLTFDQHSYRTWQTRQTPHRILLGNDTYSEWKIKRKWSIISLYLPQKQHNLERHWRNTSSPKDVCRRYLARYRQPTKNFHSRRSKTATLTWKDNWIWRI